MLNLIFDKCSQFGSNSQKINTYLTNKGKDDEMLTFSVKLVVFELAGNIVKHTKKSAVVNISCDKEYIHISVSGSAPFNLKKNILPPCNCECGRGIYIVKHICEGFEYLDRGRTLRVTINCNKALKND